MELEELRLYSKVYKDELEDEIITLDLNEFENMIRFMTWGNFRPIPNDYLVEQLGFEDWGERKINEHESERRYCLYNSIDGTSDLIIALKHSNYNGEDYFEWVAYIDNEQINTVNEICYIHQVQELYYVITGFVLH